MNEYCSATAYDRATHALILARPVPVAARRSPGLQPNSDGSVDVYFAPAAPTGRETSWVPTNARGHFEVLFRFYGPNSLCSKGRGRCRTSNGSRFSDEGPVMINLRTHLCAALLLAAGTHSAFAQAQPAPPTPAGNSVPVTADNIVRAELDVVFTGLVAQGGFGKIYHNREERRPTAAWSQRPNRATHFIQPVCLTSMPGR